jgi:hypothetical protein
MRPHAWTPEDGGIPGKLMEKQGALSLRSGKPIV